MADKSGDAEDGELSGEASGPSEDAERGVDEPAPREQATDRADAYDDSASGEPEPPEESRESDASEKLNGDDEPEEPEAPSEPEGPEGSDEPEHAARSNVRDDPEADDPSSSKPLDEPGPEARKPRSTGRVGTVISVFGELLITAGVVLALFVVYSLWWTNVVANRAAERQGEKVRDGWSREDSQEEAGERDLKNGVGFLHVPSMTGDDILVTRGTDVEKLNDGVAGYYTQPVKSALPWDQSGNFSVAAHRDGHGAKFHDIDKIDQGDPVVFETKHTWYVYKVYETLPETSRYNVDVLDPIPEESGKDEAGRYITLTTCTPVYTSEHRYVVWGELVRTESVNEQRIPPKEIR